MLKTTKRGTFYVILFLALLAALAPGPARAESWLDVADTSWYDEAQTEFTISTEAQLAGLAKLSSEGTTFEGKTVRLDRDLDLTTKEWTSIGFFLGTFDGRGHLVKLKAPLFHSAGNTKQPATLLDLNLSGDIARSCTNTGSESNFNLASLANICFGTIRNCSFTGSIVLEHTYTTGMVPRLYLGGIVGEFTAPLTKTGEISGCRVRAWMTVKSNLNNEKKGSMMYIGGIACKSSQKVAIRNCVFEGGIYAEELGNPRSLNVTLGGIAAWNNAPTENCRARFATSLSIPDETKFYAVQIGGIAGKQWYFPITSCLADWTVSEDFSKVWEKSGSEVCVGGITGELVEEAADLTNCVASVDLAVGNVPPEKGFLGGLYGRSVRGADLYNCFVQGRVAGGGKLGGFAGQMDAGSQIQNCSTTCAVLPESGASAGVAAGWSVTVPAAIGNDYNYCHFLVDQLAGNAIVGNDPDNNQGMLACFGSEQGFPATAALLPPMLALTERKSAPVSAEVYPLRGQKNNVTYSWTTDESGVLEIGSPNAETAAVKGLKEGTAPLKLSCGGLLGKNTCIPVSSVTVRRVRLESLTLSPKTIELKELGEQATIRAAITPGADVVSFPQFDWRFAAESGGTQEEHIELVPAADGLGATVKLIRPTPGEKYRVTAHAMDGSGLSDDVEVSVRYVPATPTSPDVSTDVSSDVSPDVSSSDVSTDVSSTDVSSSDVDSEGEDEGHDVIREPETGVSPKLPQDAPAGLGSSAPSFFDGREEDALQSAAVALSESGLTEEDLVFDEATGVVRVSARLAREVAKKAFASGSSVRRVRPLPVLTATLPSGSNVAAVGLELTGSELMSERASLVNLLKVTGPNAGKPMRYASRASEFSDGCFTVLDADGNIVEELGARGRYVLTLFIEDGGEFDLDGESNGRIVDPTALVSMKAGPVPPSTPDIAFDPNGGGGGGGCDAGFGFLLLLAVAPVVLYRKR